VEQLREAAKRAVDGASLRKVAAAVPMSPTGLRSFLDGGAPYSGTRRKLAQWYVRETARGWGVAEDAAVAAFSIILDGIPDDDVDELRRTIEALIRANFSKREAPPPAWLDEADEDESGAP